MTHDRELLLKARERLVELEIEKDEKDKSLILVQEIRQKERNALNSKIDNLQEEAKSKIDETRADCSTRMEKQVSMIEQLLHDKN